MKFLKTVLTIKINYIYFNFNSMAIASMELYYQQLNITNVFYQNRKNCYNFENGHTNLGINYIQNQTVPFNNRKIYI